MLAVPEHGGLDEIPLPRLLLDLQRTRFGGALALERERVAKRFLFHKGSAVFAESNLASESLGVQLMDAGRLTREDGKGQWWEGLDPQELYTGPNIHMPDGIRGIDAVKQWHLENTRPWTEAPPPGNSEFTRKWLLRCQDLVDKYRPDLLYFDNFDLPLGQAGLDMAAYYYNANLDWNGGKLEAVINVKKLPPERRAAVVDDIERGSADELRDAPWQTDTCLGNWHYDQKEHV